MPRSIGLLTIAATLAACSSSRDSTSPPIPPEYLCEDTFTVFFRPDTPAADASVVGDFNAWDGADHPLVDDDGDGLAWRRIDASPGTHLYGIEVDGEIRLDGYNPLTLFDEAGEERSAVHVPDCAGAPALEVHALTATTDGTLDLDLRFRRAADAAALDPGSLAATLADGTPLEVDVASVFGDVMVWASGLAPGKHQVRVRAADVAGREVDPVVLPVWVEDAPFDWRDAVIYQVMVDRFQRGDGAPLDAAASISHYHGGDLDGVTAALEAGYFQELGANVLWISPVYENPEGEFIGRDGHPAEAYHGYWPSAPRAVESRWGGEAALRRLITAAHDRGLRVIVDLVLNHVHTEHPYFREHAGPEWFNHPAADCICGMSCPWSGYIETCWFDPFLADLRWRNRDVVEQLVDDALWWLETFDLDGLRLDAIMMMPRLATRHLRDRLRRTLDAGGNHTYLLGETYTDRGGQPIIRYYLGPQGLSGQFDFPVMWALRDGLAGRIPLTELDATVRASEAAWSGAGAVMATILGNHDVPRFLSDVNGDPIWQPRTDPPPVPDRDKPYDLLKIAWTFVLGLPGAPVIYYGDEVGFAGATDPDNRRDMRFGEALSARERAVRDHVSTLGRARTCSAALRRGARETLLVHDNLYVFGRDAGDGFPAVVVLNRATVPRTETVTLPAGWALDPAAAPADVLGGTASLDGRALTVTVPPRAAALLLSDPGCATR